MTETTIPPDPPATPPAPPDRQVSERVVTRAALTQIAILVAISITLRAWALAEQRSGNPLLTSAILDDAVYLDLATEFADGAPARPWFLAPLYGWVLGLIGKLLGTKAITILAASCVSLVCGVATTGLITVCGRLLGGARAGWIAGGLHACAGAFVFSEILPGQEPLLGLLYTLAFLLSLLWHRGGAGWTATAFGVLVGIATLGRGTSLFLLPAALPLLLRAREAVPDRRLRDALPAVGLALAGLAAVLLPPALRNHDVTGDFTPLPWSFGSNLYASNGPESRRLGSFQSSELGGGPRAKEKNAPRIAERELGRSLTPMEVSAYWRGRTFEESGSAGDVASHLWRKTLLFAADHDIASNHSPHVERRYSTWLRIVPVSGWWIFAFGAFGWWVVRRRHPGADVAAIVVGLTAVSLIILFPATRYRLPLLPICAAVGAAGVLEFRGASLARRGGAMALATGVSVLALLPGWQDLTPNQHGASRCNLAQRLLERKRVDEAITILREGHAEEPKQQKVLLLLARALETDGQTREAADARQRLEVLINAGPIGRLRKMRELLRDRDAGPAALAEAHELGTGLLQELFSRAPRTEVQIHLAVIAARRGDDGAATMHADAARELSPNDPIVKQLDTILREQSTTPGSEPSSTDE